MAATVTVDYEPVIGLEVHAQLLTETKLFCGCRAGYGVPPNAATCPVCLGFPGALPALNKRAVEYAIKAILAVGGGVLAVSVFARKSYFYPDLPKGYQITQYDRPMGTGGAVTIESPYGVRNIAIARIHLEEDAGKSLHPEGDESKTRLDYNRCGVPLIEIVTRPDIHSPHEAYAFLVKLKQILQYLGVCSGDMEKGALRCDANISMRPGGSTSLGVKTELKNLNSFKAVERALAYEIARQSESLSSGEAVQPETFSWDDRNQTAVSMRGKETSEDYRYFPDPDLPVVDCDLRWIEQIKADLPELPDARKERFQRQYGLTEYDAGVLTAERPLADYFESLIARSVAAKSAATWVSGEILQLLNDERIGIETFPVGPDRMGELLKAVEDGAISRGTAREVFAEMVGSGRRAGEIISARGLIRISDAGELRPIIAEILRINQIQVQRYRSGKESLFDFFFGQVMKHTGGMAAPEAVKRLLEEMLHE